MESNLTFIQELTNKGELKLEEIYTETSVSLMDAKWELWISNYLTKSVIRHHHGSKKMSDCKMRNDSESLCKVIENPK